MYYGFSRRYQLLRTRRIIFSVLLRNSISFLVQSDFTLLLALKLVTRDIIRKLLTSISSQSQSYSQSPSVSSLSQFSFIRPITTQVKVYRSSSRPLILVYGFTRSTISSRRIIEIQSEPSRTYFQLSSRVVGKN